jgi:hypothetical protein
VVAEEGASVLMLESALAALRIHVMHYSAWKGGFLLGPFLS